MKPGRRRFQSAWWDLGPFLLVAASAAAGALCSLELQQPEEAPHQAATTEVCEYAPCCPEACAFWCEGNENDLPDCVAR